MTTHATGSFAIESWDEKPYDEAEGQATLVRASVKTSYAGDMQAQGSVEYLMAYAGNAAYFTGLERVTGRIGERSGSFVLQISGTYENGVATSRWFVVPASGTGDLKGLRGEGGYGGTHDKPVYTLDYDFE